MYKNFQIKYYVYKCKTIKYFYVHNCYQNPFEETNKRNRARIQGVILVSILTNFLKTINCEGMSYAHLM